jgi:hypothetical protein
VNDAAETLGAPAAAELVPAALDVAAAELVVELELELELDDELPQADTPTLATTASAAKTLLLFSKCTVFSSLLRLRHFPDPRTRTAMSH